MKTKIRKEIFIFMISRIYKYINHFNCRIHTQKYGSKTKVYILSRMYIFFIKLLVLPTAFSFLKGNLSSIMNSN